MAYLIEFSGNDRYHPDYDIHVDPVPAGLEEFSYLKTLEHVSHELVPKRARIRSSHKSIPEIGSIRWYWGVSQRFKDLVEARESGVHQFFPIEIIYKNGRSTDQQFYIFHICRMVDALIVEKSNVVLQSKFRGRQQVEIKFGTFNVVLDRKKISGCHVWRGAEGPYEYFSDDLFSALKRVKLDRGLHFYHTNDA